MENLVYWNGEIIKDGSLRVSFNDEGLLYGYGVFETIPVVQGRPVFLQEHLRRLFDALAVISISIENSSDDLKKMIEYVIKINRLEKGSLRLTVTSGDPSLTERRCNVLVTCKHGVKYSEVQYKKGFNAGISSIKKNQFSPLVYIKSTSFLENILARQEALQNGWDEILFTNISGFLTEGSITNLFIVKDEKIFTPSVKCGLLPGIVRQKILGMVLKLGCQILEGQLTCRDLLSSQEAFLTNSLMGIMPLVKINGSCIGGGEPGPVTGKISESYSKMLRELI